MRAGRAYNRLMSNLHAAGLRPAVAPLRILIADECDRVRAAARDLIDLQVDLLVVGEAVEAEAALCQAVAARPDLILLDARLPGGPGPALLVRLHAGAPTLPVVVYAANPAPGEREQALAAGAAAFLAKDVLPHDLLAALRRAGRGQPAESA